MTENLLDETPKPEAAPLISGRTKWLRARFCRRLAAVGILYFGRTALNQARTGRAGN